MRESRTNLEHKRHHKQSGSRTSLTGRLSTAANTRFHRPASATVSPIARSSSTNELTLQTTNSHSIYLPNNTSVSWPQSLHLTHNRRFCARTCAAHGFQPAHSADQPYHPIHKKSSGTQSSASSSGGGHVFHVRPALLADYWPAADLHVRVFNADMKDHTSWQGIALRVDRVVALQINDRLAEQGAGRSALLLAVEGPPPGVLPDQLATEQHPQQQQRHLASGPTISTSPTSTRITPVDPPGPLSAFPQPLFFLGGSLAPGVRPGVGVSAQSLGLLGVAALDSFCDLVPPRELNWRTDGQMGWYRRDGYAYVSNVAVAEGARRRGVARGLMAAAEALAAEWGCRAVGLHCNPKKSVPWALYRSLGYRDSGVVEPAIMPYLQGRPPDRCSFLVKRVAEGGAAGRRGKDAEGAGGGVETTGRGSA